MASFKCLTILSLFLAGLRCGAPGFEREHKILRDYNCLTAQESRNSRDVADLLQY